MASVANSFGVSGASGFWALVTEPLMAHSRMTGVFSTVLFLAADADTELELEAEQPATNIAPAPANVLLNSLLFIVYLPSLADLDRAVLIDSYRITRHDSLKKLVTELINRDDALPIPDVTHVKTGG